MPTGTTRAARLHETRELILDAAERLFAEDGLGVSNRRVGEAAGQGNNTAVGYHFGTKLDLVRAIVRRHAEDTERRRADMLDRIRDSTELRDWVECMVRPITDHLAELGTPTWYARFLAQVSTDPLYRIPVQETSLESEAMRRNIAGIDRCFPAVPPRVRVERGGMTRQLIIHMPAERERQLAVGEPTASESWDETGTRLVEAIVAISTAPVTAAGA